MKIGRIHCLNYRRIIKMKKDKRMKYELKYLGIEERMVHLAHRKFKINKNDKFNFNIKELESFKDKKEFKKVK